MRQAHIERFMGSLKRECLNHFIFLSEDHLRRTVVAYIAYYNEARPHQGIEGIPEFGPGLPRASSARDRAWQNQVRGSPGAWWASPRLPTCRLAPVRSKSLRLAPAGSVIPGRSQLPHSELRRAQRVPLVRRLIRQESR